MGIHAITPEKTTPCQVCAAPMSQRCAETFDLCDCGWLQDGNVTDDFAHSEINGMTVAQAQCHVDEDGYTDPEMQELGETIAQYGKELQSRMHYRMKTVGHVHAFKGQGRRRKKTAAQQRWGGRA